MREGELVPQLVAWEATRACRFACIHCRAVAQPQADPQQLTSDEAFGLVDQISEFARPVLIITGGDPLMREDSLQVARHASDRGLRVVMSPSGSDIDARVVERMKASGVRRVSVSVDGATADVHDAFRGVPGAFNLALRSIGHYLDGGMPFQIHTTVTRRNLKELGSILLLAEELRAAAWDIFMLVPTGRASVQLGISPQEYEAVLNRIYDWNLSSKVPIKVTCSPHYMRIIAQRSREDGSSTQKPNSSISLEGIVSTDAGRRPHPDMGGRGCMAGNGFCFISHTGDIYGCGFLPVKAGSIREQSFKEIYQRSQFFQALRDWNLLRGRCGACEYRALCGGCRARALSVGGSSFGEEPYCTHQPQTHVKPLTLHESLKRPEEATPTGKMPWAFRAKELPGH